MSEVKQFRLPDVGEGLTEADIVAWHVKPGDSVALNQVIVEIETAKAVVELPSPYEGVVAELLAEEGATVDVGTPIITVDVSGEITTGGEGGSATTEAAGGSASGAGTTGQAGLADPVTAATSTPAGAESPLQAAFEPGIHGSPAPKVERQAVLVGYGVKLGTTKRRQRKQGSARTRADAGSAAGAATTPAVAPSPGASPPSAPMSGPPVPTSERAVTAPSAGNGRAGVRPAAKPPVRKLAKELGVDLAAVTGSGPKGRITRQDLLGFLRGPAPAAAPAATMGIPEIPAEKRFASPRVLASLPGRTRSACSPK